MYQSSTSSSSSQGPSSSSGGGLMRYGSAPSSLLATAVDSVISATREFSPHSHQNDLTREEPTAKDNNITNIGLQRSYGFGGRVGCASPSLVRHSSSPAGFLNQLAAAAGDNGFCITRGIGGDNGISRLNSQLSFTRQQSSTTLSHISEENDDIMNVGSMNGTERKSNNCYSSSGGFGIINNRSWDVNETNANHNNTIAFSMAMQPNKRAKTNMENQFEFSMGMGQGTVEGSLDITTMEKLMHIPQDSVPCKIRAKRGCATHPRSIAERERRTRISGKLKKLQILVPNMDKQTSYSDMLDLAVQHIKSLQNQVQKLNQEIENCSCGCNTKDL